MRTVTRIRRDRRSLINIAIAQTVGRHCRNAIRTTAKRCNDDDRWLQHEY